MVDKAHGTWRRTSWIGPNISGNAMFPRSWWTTCCTSFNTVANKPAAKTCRSADVMTWGSNGRTRHKASFDLLVVMGHTVPYINNAQLDERRMSPFHLPRYIYWSWMNHNHNGCNVRPEEFAAVHPVKQNAWWLLMKKPPQIWVRGPRRLCDWIHTFTGLEQQFWMFIVPELRTLEKFKQSTYGRGHSCTHPAFFSMGNQQFCIEESTAARVTWGKCACLLPNFCIKLGETFKTAVFIVWKWVNSNQVHVLFYQERSSSYLSLYMGGSEALTLVAGRTWLSCHLFAVHHLHRVYFSTNMICF